MADRLVSVALATYNGARYIREQLDDIAQQARPPAEIVVSDDGSSDDTLAIVERFASAAPFPVRIHRNPRRLGYRENFFRCAERCTSELIAFSDQDDRWHPRKLEIVADHFADDEVLVLYHNAGVFTERRGRIGALHPPRIGYSVTPPLVGDPWAFSTGFTQLFRRSLLAFSDLWEMSLDQWHAGERLAHDQWFHFLASVLGKIVYLPEELAQYRQHDSNVFGWARQRPGSQLLVALRRGVDAYELHAHAACVRSLILERAAERLEGTWRDRAVAGAKAYRSYAARHAQRVALYRGRGFGSRARAFRNLLAMNAYARTPWHFPSIDLVKDFSLGLSGLRLPPLHDKPRVASGSGA